MAKNKIEIDVKVDDKGTTKKVALESKKAAKALDETGKSARTADRNLKGAAQASANGTKNFSKMSQGMGGLVAVYATIAAQVFAVTAAFTFFRNAVDFKNLIAGQEALAASSGIAYKTITSGIQSATNAQLDYASAAKAAAIGSAAGLSPSQLENLGKAAKNASIALGRDLGDSFDRLIRGAVKAEPELLDELGIILRLKPATEKYAQSIGASADSLNAFQRTQAVTNEVLAQAEDKFGLIEAQLDPTTASLNKFLKSFSDIKNSLMETLAGPIAGLASFFSNNMPALIGALSLFGLSILKQIIPNLTQWRSDSKLAIDEQKAKLKELRAELQATALQYQSMLKPSQAKAVQQTSSLLGESPSERGAIGFLSGQTTDKRAMNAAEKALTAQENNLKNHLGKKKLLLSKFTSEEIVIMRAGFEARKAMMLKSEADYGASLERQKLKTKMWGIEIAMLGPKLEGMFARVGAGAARFLGFLGWVGVIISVGQLLIGVGSSIIDMFKKVDEQQEAANKRVEEGTERYKTLNEEIQRTQNYLKSNPQGGTATLTAISNNVLSADVSKLIQDINSLNDPLVKNSKNFLEFRSGLADTAKELKDIDPRFAALSSAIELETALNEGQVQALKKARDEYGELNRILTQTQERMNTTNSAITALIGTISKPFGSEALAAINTELVDNVVGANKFNELLAEIEAQKPKTMTRTYGSEGKTAEFIQQGDEYLLVKEGSEGQKVLNKLTDDYNKKLKKTQDELDTINKRNKYLGILYKNLNDAITKTNTIRSEEAKNLKKAAEMQTRGITIANKLTNIEVQRIRRGENLNKLTIERELLEAQRLTILQEAGGKEEDLTQERLFQYNNLKAMISQLGTEIEIKTVLNALEEQGSKAQERALEFQKEQNKLRRDALDVQKSLNDAVLEEKRIKSGVTGAFGFEQARQAAAANEIVLRKQLRASQEASIAASRNLVNDSIKFFYGDIDQTALTAAEGKSEEASTKAQEGLLELDIFQKRFDILVQTQQAENEILGLRLDQASLNPAAEKYTELTTAALKLGVELTPKMKEELQGLAEEYTLLQATLEGLKSVFSSIETNMTNALASVIDGTKSVKDAFKDMAVAILKDIAKVIAQLLVKRALMAIGFGFADGGVAPGGFEAFANGGYAKGGFRAFASGGMVKEPTLGLVGEGRYNEAIVPLPDGKSIPVDLKGAGQQNNVTVNVSVDSNGNAQQNSQSNGQQGANLGNAIAAAVQKELQNQKRSGGILSPYGAA